jgi:putative DNA primase/helicase
MISARKLYSDVFEFKPQFEIVLMCNEKPTIEDKTNGAWRRVQVYPFVSRFVDDNNQINHENNVYKRDKSLPTKLEHWSIVFMCMLMKEWVSMGGGIDEDSIPESIRMETENYKNQNDIVGQWIREDLDVCEEEPTPFNEMWNAFENWFTDNHSNGKVDKIVVRRRLIEWQKQSRFGFSDDMNGSERHPRFNLIPKSE